EVLIMFQNVIIGWIARRALEIGGLVGALLTAWNNLPPGTKDAILMVLGRNWETITLGALAPIAISLWGYVWSALSTFKPQVITADKRQIPSMAKASPRAVSRRKLSLPRSLALSGNG